MDKFLDYLHIPCVRCGYCCKKATCHVGLTHGAEPTNCKFLVGDKPGKYSCFLALKDIYPNVEMHLGIGSGCCEPLNSDRKIAIENMKGKQEKEL